MTNIHRRQRICHHHRLPSDLFLFYTGAGALATRHIQGAVVPCKNKQYCVAASIHTCIARHLLWHFYGDGKQYHDPPEYAMEFAMTQQLIEAASPLSAGQKRQLAASGGVIAYFSFKVSDPTTCVRTQALPKTARQIANARMDNCLCTRSRWSMIGIPLD